MLAKINSIIEEVVNLRDFLSEIHSKKLRGEVFHCAVQRTVKDELIKLGSPLKKKERVKTADKRHVEVNPYSFLAVLSYESDDV